MSHRNTLGVAGWLIAVVICGAAQAGFVFEDFTTDPGWVGVNNTVNQNNYGYSGGTNFAGGAVGEAGGTTGRETAANSSVYRDIQNVTPHSLNQGLSASGSFIMQNPAGWDHGIAVGHMNAGDGGDLVALVMSEPAGAFTQSRVRAVVQRDNGLNTIAATPQLNVTRDVPHTFSYTWNPFGGVTGQGILYLTIDGVTMSSEDTGGIFNLAERTGSTPFLTYNAWGISVPGVSFAASTVEVFIDNVSYSVPEPASAAAMGLCAVVIAGRRRR